MDEGSVQRYFRIHRAGPSVDATPHGLHPFESLLAEPIGDRQRSDSVMAHDDDMVVGIEFLMSARGHIAHGNVFLSLDARLLPLGRFPHIEEREGFTPLLKRFDLAGRDFEIH